VYESNDVDRDLDEAVIRGAPAPYGRVLWPSAHACASALRAVLRDHRAEDGEVPSVVELGCGTGLCALIAARAGAAVLATDVDEGALVAVQAASAHFPGARLTTSVFDVLGSEPIPPGQVVVAADLLYEELLALAMARRAAEAVARGGVVIIGDPGRVFRARFDALMGACGSAPQWRARDKKDGVVVAVLS
jgi:predicted nicotinamide N-methyase